MKRNSKKIIVVSAALLIVLVILLIPYIKKRISYGSDLTNLSNLTKENHLEMNEKCDHYISLKQNSEQDEEQSDNNGEATKYKSLDDIKEILKSYPGDYDTALQTEGFFLVAFGFPLFGTEIWDHFVANCRLGRPGNMVMCQFSADFQCVYYYIEFNGEGYHVVEDRSRDYEDDLTYAYSECFSRYFHVEKYSADAGYAEYAYLTDDDQMTYKKVYSYYMEGNPNGLEEPSSWEFYTGVVTHDMIENSIKWGEGEEFFSKYTGFVDIHPYYLNENLMMDYDGDGILDRIYRDYTEDGDSSGVSAYLMLGNGENVVLSQNVWSDHFATYPVDGSEGGSKDICFRQYSDDDSESIIFRYVNGQYIKEE